jgi:hypothetical protein
LPIGRRSSASLISATCGMSRGSRLVAIAARTSPSDQRSVAARYQQSERNACEPRHDSRERDTLAASGSCERTTAVRAEVLRARSPLPPPSVSRCLCQSAPYRPMDRDLLIDRGFRPEAAWDVPAGLSCTLPPDVPRDPR